MRLTERERVALRVLRAGIAVGGGLLATAHGCPPELAGMVGVGTSLGEGAFRDAVGKLLTANPKHACDLLCDGSLVNAVGEAIAQITEEYVHADCPRANKGDLGAIAKQIKTLWPKIVAGDAPELAGLTSADVPAFVGNVLATCTDEGTPALDAWQWVVRELAAKKPLPADVADALARALHGKYADKLCSVLTGPTEIGGKAYKTISLALVGRILVLLEDTHATVHETAGDVRAIREIVEGRARTLADFPVSGRHEIPVRNERFTGRETLLQTLHAMLQRGAPIALTGIPGVGKTDTAARYIHQYRSDLRGVHWVNADTTDDLGLGFTDIARRLQILLPENATPEQVRAIVKAHLSDNPGWLLVFNNVGHATDVADYFPGGPGGQILLTTRPGDTATVAEPLVVDVMDDQEGADLLLNRARWLTQPADADANGLSHRRNAETLSGILGGLPLALDQAGAYMEAKGKTPLQYQALYAKRSKDLLKERGNDRSRHADSVDVTFSLAFEQVESANPAAADLLRACAFLAPDAIPVEIFTEGASELGDHLGPLADDEYAWDNAVERAARLALLRHDPKTRTLSVHRLVQTVLRNRMTDAENRDWAERIVRAVAETFPDIEFSNWNDCERLLPHALACSKLVEDFQMVTETAGQLLNQIGYYLHERGQYIEAEPLHVRALAIYERSLGPDHAYTGTSINNLAELYRSQGRFAEAEPLHMRALGIMERTHGPEHWDTVVSLNNLAALYNSQGRYAEAEPLLVRSLAARENTLGPDHPDTALGLNNLAALYNSQGRYAEAKPLYVRAIGIVERTLGPDHPTTATCLSNLAGLYRDQGRFAEAEPLLARSLAICEKSSGPAHPDTATGLNNLAELYRSQGRYAESEPLHVRSLTICERSLGPDHPDTAMGLNNLAGLYNSQGRYAEAEPLLVRSLAIWENSLGPEHPSTTTGVTNYISFLDALGRAEEANALRAKLPQDNDAA